MSTRTRTEILSQVKVDNIIQFTLSQSFLESNFKAILEALQDHDDGIVKVTEKQEMSEKSFKEFSNKT